MDACMLSSCSNVACLACRPPPPTLLFGLTHGGAQHLHTGITTALLFIHLCAGCRGRALQCTTSSRRRHAW